MYWSNLFLSLFLLLWAFKYTLHLIFYNVHLKRYSSLYLITTLWIKQNLLTFQHSIEGLSHFNLVSPTPILKWIEFWLYIFFLFNSPSCSTRNKIFYVFFTWDHRNNVSASSLIHYTSAFSTLGNLEVKKTEQQGKLLWALFCSKNMNLFLRY